MSEPDTPAPREPVSTKPLNEMDSIELTAALARPPAVEGEHNPQGMCDCEECRESTEGTREPDGWMYPEVVAVISQLLPFFPSRTREATVPVFFRTAPSAAPTGTRLEALMHLEGAADYIRARFSEADRCCDGCGKNVRSYVAAIEAAAALRVPPEGRTDAERPFGPEATDANRVDAGEVAPREADCSGWEGECLSMVREALVTLLGEESMSKTPPMMYPEAIFAAVKAPRRSPVHPC